MRSLKLLIIIFSITILLVGCSSNKKSALSSQELAEQQVEELYHKAKQALNKGHYSFAIQYYEALETNYPFGEYTEQAKLDMIYAYNRTGQTDKAISAADNFIELYPTHKNIDYAYYMKGVVNFEKKQSKLDRYIKGNQRAVREAKPLLESEEAFQELIRRYPQSTYTEDAKQRIIYLNNVLAKRELSIAQYYYDHQTYVAALNRCKHIIYKYENTPSVEGALVLMEKAYLKMGLQDLANNTQKVLTSSFPDYQKEPFSVNKKNFLKRLFSPEK